MKRLLTIALCAAFAADAAEWDERAIPRNLDRDALAAQVEADGPGALIDEGERLFRAKFTRADGAGRPNATQAIVPTARRRPAERAFQRLSGPDANSCAGCHNDPVVGGAGGFAANAFVSEGFTSADFDTLDPQFSNERGTTHLFGAGLIELLAREMTAELRAQRDAARAEARETGAPVTAALSAKGVDFGAITARPDGAMDVSRVDGVDADLIIRPFGQKGVIVSLRQFSVNALNAHHGIQATERFGARWTGTEDFDGDGVAREASLGDVTALVAWQAALAPPQTRAAPSPEWEAAAGQGSAAFDAMGCASCHKRALPLESLVFTDPGPYDAAGTLRAADGAAPIHIDLSTLGWAARLPRDAEGRALVPLFGDLKRHVMADARRKRLGDELLGQRFVARDAFMTAELWGAGDSAPYGHRGDITTLDEAIRAHGGAAAEAARAYEAADDATRGFLIAFLRLLGAPE